MNQAFIMMLAMGMPVLTFGVLIVVAAMVTKSFRETLHTHRVEMDEDRKLTAQQVNDDRKISAEVWHGYIELKIRQQQQLLERLWVHDKKLDLILERNSGPSEQGSTPVPD